MNNDLPGIGTEVEFIANDGPKGQKKFTVAGFAMTCDPTRPGSPQRPLLVLAMDPGFYSQDRSVFVSAHLTCPEHVREVRRD